MRAIAGMESERHTQAHARVPFDDNQGSRTVWA
jgi:hypothetical protein